MAQKLPGCREDWSFQPVLRQGGSVSRASKGIETSVGPPVKWGPLFQSHAPPRRRKLGEERHPFCGADTHV